MTTKFNRESTLIIVTAVMIIIGLFYYGNIYLIEPIQEEANAVTETVDSQQSLVETYPSNEEVLEEYEATYTEMNSVLPLGAQVTDALVTLEQLAGRADVSITSVSRTEDRQVVDRIPEEFVKNIYTVQVTSNSPTNFRQLINLLIDEERVWNISSFSYSKTDAENYTGSFNFELYYRIDDVE